MSALPALRLRLPATSANLGPGFDTAAIALDFGLNIEARPAAEFSIEATGRDAERCARLEDNLVIELYRSVLQSQGRPVLPLALRMQNEIPLGMGCGSSAAGRLAAIALAVHFGDLDWDDDRILLEACRLEGHPDNVAACWLGGFVVAAQDHDQVKVSRLDPPPNWQAILVLPTEPLATSKARAVLPDSYTREDVVHNLQAVALLGLAFAQGRGDLLRTAMRDRIHQPYRASICAQLPLLLPLSGQHGIIGVALSGAGPAVLIVLESAASFPNAESAVLSALCDLEPAELLRASFELRGANRDYSRPATESLNAR